jgi:hypothetical protein
MDVQEHSRQLIGKLLHNPNTISKLCLPVNAVYGSANKLIYLKILDAVFNGPGGVDVLTCIVESLGDQLAECGGVGYLLQLLENAQTSIAPTYEAKELAKAYRDEQARDAIQQMVNDLAAGADPLRILESATVHAERLEDGEAKEKRFPVISSAELSAMDCRVEYWIPGLIVKRQPHVWGGPSKGMKTSSALDAAIAMAIGGHFLGYFAAEQAKGVLFLSGESGLATLKETAERICAAAGRRLADLKRLHWCTSLPRLDRDEDIHQLLLICKELGIDVLFIDPLYLCMPGDDAGNMFIMGGMLRKLSAMAEKIGLTVIMLHHTTRAAGKEFEPLELTSLAWAGIPEFARAWVLVNRRERYEDGTGLHRLWMVAGGSAGHSGCWALTIEEGTRQDIGGRVWRTQVLKREEAHNDHRQRQEDAKERAASAEAERHLQKLLVAAERYPAGGVKRELKDASGLKPSPFDAALALALERGVLVGCDVVRGNKQTYPGYQLETLRTTADHCGLDDGPQSQPHTADPPSIRRRSSVVCVTPEKANGTADQPILFTGAR